MAEGGLVDIVYLDFAKAFDMVPHARLLHRLKAYGVEDSLMDWFESFLTGRRQRVVLGQDVSDWSLVFSGVPQGLVIGPLLFIIYINDLPEKLINKFKLYADDSKIIAKVGDSVEKASLQEDISSVVNWTKTWLMKLNAGKCKVMHLGKRENEGAFGNYLMEDVSNGELKVLCKTHHERDLGVIFSSDLTWRAHIQMITSKANRILGQLKIHLRLEILNCGKTLHIFSYTSLGVCCSSIESFRQRRHT